MKMYTIILFLDFKFENFIVFGVILVQEVQIYTKSHKTVLTLLKMKI